MSYSKVASQDITVLIYNPRNAESKSYTINTGTGQGLLKQPIGSMKVQDAVYLDISGYGLDWFNGARIEYRPERRGYASIV